MDPGHRSDLIDKKPMRVLAIAPHPDDETLGCGGTLLKHKAAGDDLHWLIVTRAYEPQWTAQVLQDKEREIQSVGEAYGFQKTLRANLPTARLDTVAQFDLIDELKKAIDEVRPDVIYLNHAGDIHSDHRITFYGVMSALKSFNSRKHGVQRLLSYETLSSTEAAPPNSGSSFVPNVFSDVTSFIERKLEIMSLYASEVQPCPMPRAPENIRALARYRGATIGVDYAEAFMLVRELI